MKPGSGRQLASCPETYPQARAVVDRPAIVVRVVGVEPPTLYHENRILKVCRVSIARSGRSRRPPKQTLEPSG